MVKIINEGWTSSDSAEMRRKYKGRYNTNVINNLIEFMTIHESGNYFGNESAYFKMYKILNQYQYDGRTVDEMFVQATPTEQKEMINLISNKSKQRYNLITIKLYDGSVVYTTDDEFEELSFEPTASIFVSFDKDDVDLYNGEIYNGRYINKYDIDKNWLKRNQL